MKTSSVLLLAGALILAAGSALLARALMRPPPPEIIVKEVPVQTASAEPGRQVLVAAKPLEAGDFIDSQSIRRVIVPLDDLRLGDMEASKTDERTLFGTALRQPLQDGERLRSNMLVKSGDPGFLAAVLRPGMRAISVPTSVVASNAGLVAADDTVDVILSQQRPAIGAEDPPGMAPSVAAQVIVSHVRVLAVGQDTGSLVPTGMREEDAAPQRQQRQQYVETVTLEVCPGDARRLAVAKELGTLQLAIGKPDPDAMARHRAGACSADTADTQGVTRVADTTDIYLRNEMGSGPRPFYRIVTYGGKEGPRAMECSAAGCASGGGEGR